MPWGLDIWSRHGWPVHWVEMHSISKYDPFASAAERLISSSLDNTEVWWSGRITGGWQSRWRTLCDSLLSSLTSAPTLQGCLCQDQRGTSLTTSAPVSNLSTPAYKYEVWPFCSLLGTEKQTVYHVVLTVQSIDLPMENKAWWFWITRQLNGCSTPAPRSSEGK